MDDPHHHWTVGPESVGARLDRFVADQGVGTRAQVKRSLLEGRLTVDGLVPAKAGTKLKLGEQVTFRPPVATLGGPLVAEDLPLEIVHEDDAVLVVNKASGVVVHPAPGHPTGTLVNALLFHVEGLTCGEDAKRPGIVHRIDKDTTGLLVVAKTDAAHAHLAAQFAAHTTHRRYRAVVHGTKLDDEGTLSTWFGRSRRDRKLMTGRVTSGRRATTHWRVLARGRGLSVLELALETGRTHQIRVHLSERGYPIIADPLYGRPVPKVGGAATLEFAAARRMPRVALHAAELGFVHPTTGSLLTFSAPDPPDLAALVAAVEGPKE